MCVAVAEGQVADDADLIAGETVLDLALLDRADRATSQGR